jgi:hypothetical protein
MPTPTHSIERSARAIASERARFDDENHLSDISLQADPYGNRTPEFYIGIFNVSMKELRVPRPFGKSGRTTQGDTAREVVIPGRNKDDLYGKPFILRDIEPILRTFVGNDEISYTPTSGELLAQDVVNTNDPKGSWRTYRALNPFTAASEGNNYYDRGIFWCRLTSPDAEPDMEAVEFAIGRLEAYYNALVAEADMIWNGNPALRNQIGQPHRDAAKYLELQTEWFHTRTGPLQGKLEAAKKAQAEAKREVSDPNQLDPSHI